MAEARVHAKVECSTFTLCASVMLNFSTKSMYYSEIKNQRKKLADAGHVGKTQELRNHPGSCGELLQGLGRQWIRSDLQQCQGWTGEKQEYTRAGATGEETVEGLEIVRL